MKRTIVLIVTLAMCLMSVCAPTSAAGIDADGVDPRLMPMEFVFTTEQTIDTGDTFPPGSATFYIRIAGVYDLQGDHVISIDVKDCIYRRGINCSAHDMEVIAYESPYNTGLICWKLVGTLTFTWESPVTGIQYETAYIEGPLSSFEANNYVY